MARKRPTRVRATRARRSVSASPSVPFAILVLVAAGALGGVLYNVLAPRGIFHPAPIAPLPAAVPVPQPAVPRAPKPKAVAKPVEPRVPAAAKPVEAPPPVAQPPAEIRVIDLAEARRLLDTHGAIFVDARSSIGYEYSHIPGALNVPFSDFDAAYAREAGRLPKEAAIAVYCTSGSCDEADITLARLKAAGYRRLLHFKDGWNAWEIAEYPFEKGPGPK